MKIQTKYEPGQEVFMIHNNRVITVEIKEIKINVYINNYFKEQTAIAYILIGGVEVKEDQIFKTKKQLLNSL